jgi:hypothetical protein
MARSQVVSKKGRNSSSAKGPGQSAQAARRARRSSAGRRNASARRPTAKGKVGSKGKGAYAQRRSGGSPRGGTADADQRSLTSRDTGFKPEASQPPTLVDGDATVAEQRRAASRQRSGARTDRPPAPRRRKAGARGGGDYDRDLADEGGDDRPKQGRARRAGAGTDAADREGERTRRRRADREDSLEVGRQDLTEPGRESTRGAKPRGGVEGRRARARRATPRGTSRSARTDRRKSTTLRQTPSSR